jgi:hypothetical protein
MEFIDTSYFLSSESFKNIETGTSKELKAEMPVQIKESSALAAMGEYGDSAESGSKAFVLINLIINIVLSGSLQLLWGMVNTL